MRDLIKNVGILFLSLQVNFPSCSSCGHPFPIERPSL